MRSFSFTMEETRDIAISVAALAVIFSYPGFLADPSLLALYFVVVLVAFMGHELSHKFTAVRLGFFSEYRMWPQGLFLALVMALATNGSIVFAAPGAVYFASRWAFQSHISKREVGMIGASGPLFNIAAGTVSLAALFAFSPAGIVASVLASLAFINAWLAIFNLVPFGPLDGAKVLKWNPVVWGAMLVSAIAMYGALFVLGA